MNHYLTLFITLCLLMGIGITIADPLPNMTGTWTEEKLTCVDYSGNITNPVTEENHWIITQEDDIIKGTNIFTVDGSIVEEPIAGVISPDGKTATVVDKSGGTYFLYITDDNSLIVKYVNTGDKKDESGYAFALSQVLKRSD